MSVDCLKQFERCCFWRGLIIFLALLSCVVEEFYRQKILLKALEHPSLREEWAGNARYYADTKDLYSLPEKAADIIIGGLDG